MPTKRTRRTRQRRGIATVDTLSIEQLLCFMGGWSPSNAYERSYGGWETWQEFMRDWIAVRDEFLAREDLNREPNFAEQVYRIYGAKGPPSGATYEDIKAVIAAAEDEAAREMLADVNMGN